MNAKWAKSSGFAATSTGLGHQPQNDVLIIIAEALAEDVDPAGMSGVDTTGLASDCMDKVEKSEKELEALRARLKTAGAREAADKLTAEIADVKRRMR